VRRYSLTIVRTSRPHAVPEWVRDQERLVAQRRDDVATIGEPNRPSSTTAVASVEIEAAAEHGELDERGALGLGQAVPGGCERRAQAIATRLAEHQPRSFDELRRCHHADARGGELDRERRRSSVVTSRATAGSHAAGVNPRWTAIARSANSRIASPTSSGPRSKHVSPGAAVRLRLVTTTRTFAAPASSAPIQRRQLVVERVDLVEHDQRGTAAGERRGDPLDQRSTGRRDPEHGRDRRRGVVGGRRVRQIDPPHAAGWRFVALVDDADELADEPRLADAGGPTTATQRDASSAASSASRSPMRPTKLVKGVGRRAATAPT